MSTFSFTRRGLVSAAAAALTLSALPALAQTPIKFQLDWRFEGPAALFLASTVKGYYKAAGLDVTIDSGNGSGGTVTRVASAESAPKRRPVTFSIMLPPPTNGSIQGRSAL